MAHTDPFTAPLGAAASGRLELRHASGPVAIRAAELDVLCRATFGRPAPVTFVEGGRISLVYPRLSLARLLGSSAPLAEIELNTALPWSLAIVGGLSGSTLDLDELELLGVDLQGGANYLRVVLPRPRRRVVVRIEGGACELTVLRPAGSAAIVRVTGGASRLAFDGERYGAIGGETLLETANAASVDRYEIEVSGGASKVVVAEGGPGVERAEEVE